MPQLLARLRAELDIIPSPAPEQPGLLMRDPFRYTDAVIIVPPALVQGLALFDGEHTDNDLKAWLMRMTGDLRSTEIAEQLIRSLSENAFLENEEFHSRRDKVHREFAAAELRPPAHAGTAYPDEKDALREKLRANGVVARDKPAGADSLVAVAAPHVSPEGGWASYAAAYNKLNRSYADKTFVILGTSHYGEPDKFGLTRKPYETPLGRLRTDVSIVDSLAEKAPAAVNMEDYCHASEHTIEFQCVFLQQVLGRADVNIVPILCGSFLQSLMAGRPPQEHEPVRRFFDALSELHQTKGKELIWVLSIDLAHIGRRYGDTFAAAAEQGKMQEVRERDEARLERVCAGDAEGFYHLVGPKLDDLRWCGYSPVYTFLNSVPDIKGELLSYQQWNIDAESVVSFAGVEFTAADSR